MSIIFDMSSYQTPVPTDPPSAQQDGHEDYELDTQLQTIEEDLKNEPSAIHDIYTQGIDQFIARMKPPHTK